MKMKNRLLWRVLSMLLVAISVVNAAEPPQLTQNRKFGELRKAYRDAKTAYGNFAIQPQKAPENWEQRQKEMTRLLNQNSLPEFALIETVAGPSRMWEQRNRAVPSPVIAAHDYSAGPNGSVVPFSGELTDSATDISGISRVGVGFSLERRYASFSHYDSGLGIGWNFNYNAGIIVDGKSLDEAQSLIFFIGGRDIRFEKRDGNWSPEPGMFLRLEYNGETKRVIVTMPDLSRYELELAAEQVADSLRWRLSAFASRHDQYRANRLEITYLPQCDRIAYITDPQGQKFSFAYDASGHIVQVASDRDFVNFKYDESGKLLVKAQYLPTKLSLAGTKFAPEINYNYTVDNCPILCEKSSAALKYKLEAKYDSQQRVVSAGFVADDKQQMWEFAYPQNQITIVKSPAPIPETHYSFAGTPHPSLPGSIEIPAQQAKWQYEFNADFLLASITEPLGNRKERTYDSDNVDVLMRGNTLEEKQLPAPGIIADLKCYGNRAKYHDRIALPVAIEYYQIDNDGKETILKKETFEYSDNDLMLVCHNDGGIKQYAAYNRFGLPVLEWDANKNMTISYYAKDLPNRYSFDFIAGDVNNGGPLVRTIQDAKNAEIIAVYQAIGQKEFVRNEFSRVEPQSLETRIAYDPYGNKVHAQCGFDESFGIFASDGKLLVSCDAATGITEYQYYKSGRTDRIYHEFCPNQNQSYKGNLFTHFTNSWYYAELFKYDSLDMLAEHQLTDERFKGIVPIYKYDRYPSGRVKMIVDPMGVSRVDEYDPKTGYLQKQMLVGDGQSVVLTSKYEYYPNGQIKNYVDQFGGHNAFVLDGFGRRVAVIDAKGVTILQHLDGLDRVIEKTVTSNGENLQRAEFIYSTKNQKLETEIIWQSERNEELVSAEYRYDDVGNLIYKRGIREDSWQYFLVDGLGNTVAECNPEGDLSVKVLDRGKPVYAVSSVHEKDRKNVTIGSLVEYDFAGRVVKSTPVDRNGKLIEARTEISGYNNIGQKVKTTSPQLTTSSFVYNSLGMAVKEELEPASTSFGEAPCVTTYEYRADGQLTRKEFGNRALALRGQKDNVTPELIDAPQISKHEYDALGRMVRTTNPDGLIIEKSYNEHSLPIEMKWTHVAEPQKILRHLQLKYTVNGEVASVNDGISGKLLREYAYDDLGNCISAIDHSNPQPVGLKRQFDSMGNMTMEKIELDNLKLPASQFVYDLPAGKSSASWENLSAPRSKEYWYKETRNTDKAGRIVALLLDDEKFATWTYLGNQCLIREILERISARTDFTPLMEPLKTVLGDHGNAVGSFEYDYGPQGQPTYSATKIGDKYEFAAYSQFDVYRRLVGQNGEAEVPKKIEDARQRGNKVFGDEKNAVAAVKTSRMVYDQANNIWGRYTGAQLPNLTPQDLNKDRMPQFSSPANVIAGDSFNVSDLALRELASNRNGATASYAGNSDLKATEFKYDRLGNLIEFEGTFWNGNRRYPVKWELSFDPLGRLSSMKATALEDIGVITKDAKVAELSFVYDAENRRLLKRVTDCTRINGMEVRSEVTLFRGNQQSLIFDLEKDNELKLTGEYLWGATERELLMAALRSDQAENNNNDFRYTRYFFQQDKGLNVVFTFKVDGDRIVPVAAESYLGFGDNSTFAEIANVSSSMNGSNTERAYNRRLDEELGASWGNPGNWQYLDLQLCDETKLAQLTIWAEKFPKDFLVFVLPQNADRSYEADMERWISDQENQKKYLVAQVKDGIFGDMLMGESLTSPYRLPLRELKGNRILLVFEPSSSIDDINVREFEVVKVADNPSPIAFAGQWLDRETGMYYQINRYRLAGSDKFISPDPIGFMDGNNLYAYAKGNPLEWHDPDGRFVHILWGAGVGALFGGGGYLVQCMITGEKFSWSELGVQTAIGAITGAVSAATFGAASALSPLAAETAKYTFSKVAIDIALHSGAGFISGFTGGSLSEYARSGDLDSSIISGLKVGGFSALTAGIMRGVQVGRMMNQKANIANRLMHHKSASEHRSFNSPEPNRTNYNRPSGYRKGVRDIVWENAREESTGQVRDPLTGRFMSKDKSWDMGHKPRKEWWKFVKYAKENGLTREQILDWNNDPAHFRPELPSSNRSHGAEDLTEMFFAD